MLCRMSGYVEATTRSRLVQDTGVRLYFFPPRFIEVMTKLIKLPFQHAALVAILKKWIRHFWAPMFDTVFDINIHHFNASRTRWVVKNVDKLKGHNGIKYQNTLLNIPHTLCILNPTSIHVQMSHSTAKCHFQYGCPGSHIYNRLQISKYFQSQKCWDNPCRSFLSL